MCTKLVACFSLVSPTVLGAIQMGGGDELASTLVMGDKAVMMMPPRVIADWVSVAEWSPEGKYVLYAQTPRFTATDMVAAMMGNPVPNAQRFASAQLMAWSKATGKSVKIATIAQGNFEGAWFAGDETFVRSEAIQGEIPGNVPEGNRIFFHSPHDGSVRSMTITAPGFLNELTRNETAPLMAVIVRTASNSPTPSTVVVFDSSGTIRMRTSIPPSIRIGSVYWTEQGSNLACTVVDNSTPRQLKGLIIDSKTGVYQLVDNLLNVVFQGQERVLQNPRLVTTIAKQPAFIGAKQQVQVAILTVHDSNAGMITASPGGTDSVQPKYTPPTPSDEPTMAFIGANIEMARVAPKQDSVLYVQNGVALVREFAYMPHEAYKKMKEAAEKAEIISRAKQMGTAMLIYAADYDDMLPGAFDPNAVAPYIKNNSIMDGFIYTFSGGEMSKVDKPAETEMGYISGPGGRAVVYLDGHVRWITNPTPEAIFRSLVLK